MREVDDPMHEVDYWHEEVSSDIILYSRGGRCLKIGMFRKAQDHANAPCLMLHDGREAAPWSTARGRQLRSRPARRLVSTATNTVARLDPPCTDVLYGTVTRVGGMFQNPFLRPGTP